MKKNYLSAIIAICFIANPNFKLFAQACTADVSMDTMIHSAIVPEFIATGTVSVPYSQVIQYHMVKDTQILFSGNLVTATVDTLKITSMSGLPSGLTYGCHNSNCQILGGKTGCAKIYGTPTVSGTFPLNIKLEIDGHITLIGSPINLTLTDSIVKYSIVVSGNTGTYEIVKTNQLSLTVYPNPTTNELNIIAQNDIQADAKLVICDVQGKIISEENKNIRPGNNAWNINVSNYPNGLYFVKLIAGDRVQSSKVMISK